MHIAIQYIGKYLNKTYLLDLSLKIKKLKIN